MDQMVRYYSTKPMTRRWPMVVISNIIDISAMNAIIIWMKLQASLQCKKVVRRDLLITLAKSLAGVTANQNPPAQILVSSHLWPAPQNTNKRGDVTCALRRRTGSLRFTAATVSRAFVVNTASLFVTSAGNKIKLLCLDNICK